MGKVVRFLVWVLLAGIPLGVASCAQGDPVGVVEDALPPYGLVTSEQAVRILGALRGDQGFVLLDIRTPAEVASGHIPGAIQLDFRSGSFAEEIAAFDRDVTYLIYCRTANRTGQAYQLMAGLGFEKVYDLGGGITRWGQLGYPICVGELDDGHLCLVDATASANGR